MAERPELPENEIPDALAVRQRRWAVQWVWLLPIVAAIVGGWLAVRAILADGPTVHIRFKTAEGIEAGKTRIKYRDVDVGVVKSISFGESRTGVVVRAELSKAAESLLVEDTRFWVVRARITGGTISGISTLLSGSYIGIDPGKSSDSRRDFEGLESPPVITTGLKGKQFVLQSDDIGSLDVGSPVYFRRLEAGRVVAYELDKQGKSISVRIFVNAPYDRYVTTNTRFWHASGIDVTLDATGLKFNTESLTSVLTGGLAFQPPDALERDGAAPENAIFILHADRAQAMKQPFLGAERYALVFRESVRGLAVGAPVDFQGLPVGEVVSIEPSFNREKREFSITVEIDFYTEKLFTSRTRRDVQPEDAKPSLTGMIERGLRAQLRAANLLTGQLYVALEFPPKGTRTRTTMDASRIPPEIPTVPGSAQALQEQLASIARKLDNIPYREIGEDLRRALKSASATLERIDREIAPEARETMVEARKAMTEARHALTEARKALTSVERTLADAAPLPTEASDALREISRAAQSLRTLADYLERHPESLIRGKREEGK